MANAIQSIAQSNQRSAAVLFLLTFLAYALTSAHTVTFEDSGLFISTLKVLGLPQPPGYPAYVLLGHLFTYLPFGSLAFKIHLLSNLLGAGTAVLLFLSLRRLSFQVPPAFFSALAVASGSTFWGQVTVAEVYPLHIFIFAALFYIGLLILDQPSRNKLYILFGLFLGVGFANHWPLLVMGGPVLLAFAWPIHKDVLRKTPYWIGTAFIVAAVFYGWMMWRSQQNPVISFLGPINSLGELFDFFNRSYYRAIEHNWDSTIFDKLQFITDFIFGLLWREWYLVGAVFVLGAITAVKKYSKIQIAGLLFGLFATAIVLPIQLPLEFNILNQNVLRVFHLVSFFTAGLILPYGFEQIAKWQPRWSQLISLFIVGVAFVINFMQNDLRTDHFAEDYGRVILKVAPAVSERRAMIVGTDADVGPLSYIRYGLGERDDLDLYTQSGVFFSNRIFDPWNFNRKHRIEKTENFLKDNGLTYSTKAISIFDASQYNSSMVFNFNGILYEVSTATLTPLPATAELLNFIRSSLAEYIKNPHNANWPYYRQSIAANMCNFLIAHETEGEAFEKIRSCKSVKARYLNKIGQRPQADVLFKELLADSDQMISAERYMLRYYQLINRLDWINTEPTPPAQKLLDFAAAVEVAAVALDENKDCNNGVLTVVRSLEGRISLSENVKSKMAKFSHCVKSAQ